MSEEQLCEVERECLNVELEHVNSLNAIFIGTELLYCRSVVPRLLISCLASFCTRNAACRVLWNHLWYSSSIFYKVFLAFLQASLAWIDCMFVERIVTGSHCAKYTNVRSVTPPRCWTKATFSAIWVLLSETTEQLEALLSRGMKEYFVLWNCVQEETSRRLQLRSHNERFVDAILSLSRFYLDKTILQTDLLSLLSYIDSSTYTFKWVTIEFYSSRYVLGEKVFETLNLTFL